jgi:hypothetical protein
LPARFFQSAVADCIESAAETHSNLNKSPEESRRSVGVLVEVEATAAAS